MALASESSKDEPARLGLTPVFYPPCCSLYQTISHQLTVLTGRRRVKQDGPIQPSLWMQPGVMLAQVAVQGILSVANPTGDRLISSKVGRDSPSG